MSRVFDPIDCDCCKDNGRVPPKKTKPAWKFGHLEKSLAKEGFNLFEPSESEATLKKKWTTEDHRKMIDKNMCDMFETVLTPATVMGSSMSKFFDPKAARDKAEQQWIQQQIKIADENAARIAAEEEEDLMGLVDHN